MDRGGEPVTLGDSRGMDGFVEAFAGYRSLRRELWAPLSSVGSIQCFEVGVSDAFCGLPLGRGEMPATVKLTI